ncbi:Flp family type IVb pilin [Tepidibacillus fermentans]|uniref:Pilus assembly protein Flp/PilA n=1 Tax=Tepidibacillus fermentans TaxID=1281767 RepID=A0A4R3KIH3_9BACI|nr:Flp family type IVb pilin [Tepidibacillus fermentans]TCS83338.1 pilus assembly protein Flp/PilA [Tepidibacillus fermentans]
MKKFFTKLWVKQLDWKSRAKKSLENEAGQGMVEYGLIIALIAVVVIGALSLMGTSIRDLFTNVTSSLQQ